MCKRLYGQMLHMCVHPQGPEEIVVPLDLGLQAVLRFSAWVLGTKLQPLDSAASVFQ